MKYVSEPEANVRALAGVPLVLPLAGRLSLGVEPLDSSAKTGGKKERETEMQAHSLGAAPTWSSPS